MGLMGTLISILSTPGSWVGGYFYDNVSPSSTFITAFLLDTLGTSIFIVFLKLPRRSDREAII
jgi:predicted MFS family arabinose efflux permease